MLLGLRICADALEPSLLADVISTVIEISCIDLYIRIVLKLTGRILSSICSHHTYF